MVKKILSVISVFVTLSCCSTAIAIALDDAGQATNAELQMPTSKPKTQGSSSEFVAGEIIVKFKSTAAAGIVSTAQSIEASQLVPSLQSLSRLNTRYKLKEMEALFKSVSRSEQRKISEGRKGIFKQDSTEQSRGFEKIFKLKFDKDADVQRIAQAYALNENVEFAQPNYIYKADMVPNDYYYNTDLQNLPVHSWFQSYPDLWGIKQIDCEQAWDYAQGEGVVVAVVDTGVDRSHPDLADNMWTNSNEIPNNGIDDDDNGYVDDVFGWNFCNNTNDPSDDYGHGTHCAGTIAAIGNNSIGVIGVAPQAKIMALKFLSSSGSGTSDNGALAICYAADNGAKVISNSWGSDGTTSNPVIENAIDYARSLGCVVVVSAGNSNHDVANASPAGYAPAVTVAALDYQDCRAYFSNFGSGVDVSAPGVDILSLRASETDIYKNGGSQVVDSIYYRASGTSMACPHVSGAVAVIMSSHPDWTSDKVEEFLTHTCDCIDETNHDYVGLLGYGRVNLSNAILTDSSQPNLNISRIDTNELSGNLDGKIDPGESIVMNLTLKNIWQDASGISALISSTDPYVTITSAEAIYGSIEEGQTASEDYSFTVSADAPYGHSLDFSLEITADDDYSVTRHIGIMIPWPVRSGWPKNIVPSSITPVDVDGDGIKEVIITGEDMLGIYTAAGTSYSSVWPMSVPSIRHDPSIGDIDGDGQAEIVYPTLGASGSRSKIYAYKLDGTFVQGFPVQMQKTSDISQVVLADIDMTSPGLELVLTTEYYGSSTTASSAALYVLYGNGQVKSGFPYQFGNADTVFYDANGSIAVGDIDNDGKPEIVVGAYEPECAKFYAFDTDGQIKDGWSCTFSDNMKPMNIVMGDLDNDGKKEIVICTAINTVVLTNDGQLYNSNWNNIQIPGSSLALGDLDGDGDLEIVIGAGLKLIYAFHHDGTPVNGWPVDSKGYSNFAGAVVGAIGDIDNDREMEVITSCNSRITVFKPDGTPMASADPLAETSITDSSMVNFLCLPSIADMTGIGCLTVLGGIREADGYVCLWDCTTSGYTDNIAWAMQGHDPQRTGCYDGLPGLKGLKVGPNYGITFRGSVNGPFDSTSNTYKLFNSSSADLNWSASSDQNWVTVSPASGTIPAGGLTLVSVLPTSEALAKPAGNYAASITFTNLTTSVGNTSRPVSLVVSNGILAVTPAATFTSSRQPGGQITPRSCTYTITNTGYANMSWSAAKNADWISLSKSSGTLSPQESTTVTVSILSSADSFAAGTYTDTITFTNTTNGIGNTTRSVILTITAGYLSVTPYTELLYIGESGGPFSTSNDTYILENTGYSSISWTASKEQNWLALSSECGTLLPGESTTIIASVNSDANTLVNGVYSDTIVFANVTNGTGNTTRPAKLAIGKIVYVDINCIGSIHDGKSWSTAYRTIADGLKVAVTGQEVLVAGGDYGERLSLKSGVAVRGGYNASDGTRDISGNVTTIKYVFGADSSILDGFTISGIATNGVFCGDASPTIINNTIINHQTSGNSYGVYCTGSMSNPTINGNRFATSDYGIFCNASSSAVITNNISDGNNIGIATENAKARINNNLIINASSGITTNASNGITTSGLEISNNIICNCSTGILASANGTAPMLSNNVLFSNGTDYDGITIHSSDIHADPMLLDAEAGDFHIPFDSPCIDAGTSINAPEDDADGNLRPVDGNGDGVPAVDIGPYEVPWMIRGLVVTPSTGLNIIANSGGPFNPSSITYTIKNISSSDIDWTVSNSQNWLSLSALGGCLASGQITTVTASLNTNVSNLANDAYEDTLIFTDLTTGEGTTTRSVKLLLGAVYVDVNSVSSVHDGKNWDTAFLTVQEGVDKAVPGQEVWVAQGTYTEKNIIISKNITLKGGFLGSGITRDIDEYKTIIQSPSTRAFWVKNLCTIDGFTVSGGDQGIFLSHVPAVITNNTFIENEDKSISCSCSKGAIIANNKFVNEKIDAISTYKSSLTITDNTFSNCWRAIWVGFEGAVSVQSNKIFGGRSGISFFESPMMSIYNNLIDGCTYQGIQTSNAGSVMNNTIVNCVWGIKCNGTILPYVANNIFAYCDTAICTSITGYTINLVSNDVYRCETSYDPTNIRHATDLACDPLFFDMSAGDYHLLPGSGCIDAGDTSRAPSDDIDGLARPRDGDGDGTAVADIGCYEAPHNYMDLPSTKSVPDGSPVGIACYTTTAAFSDRFYVESADRVSGIGVLGTVSGTGKTVTVEGTMNTVDGERVITSSLVNECANTSIPLPFYMNLNALGGGLLGLQCAVQDYRVIKHFDDNDQPYWSRDLFTNGGANNIGLLVKTTGRVTRIANDVFYIDDAVSFDDGDINLKGIAVAWPFGEETMPPDGALIDILGISSCTTKNGIVVRMLRPVSEDSYTLIQNVIIPSD
ncbi:S8 family serine peptidase [bacterium]|nr:S8 family serine peptidase [bacterium]